MLAVYGLKWKKWPSVSIAPSVKASGVKKQMQIQANEDDVAEISSDSVCSIAFRVNALDSRPCGQF